MEVDDGGVMLCDYGVGGGGLVVIDDGSDGASVEMKAYIQPMKA